MTEEALGPLWRVRVVSLSLLMSRFYFLQDGKVNQNINNDQAASHSCNAEKQGGCAFSSIAFQRQ